MRNEIDVGGTTVVLLGTAHVSERSVAEVKDTIAEIDPDRVCVELDEGRLAALRDEEIWQDRDVARVIADGDGYMLLFNVLLSIYQRRIGADMDVRPGAEMLAAVDAAEAAGKEVELIDRDINVTLKRAMNGLSLIEKFRIMNTAIEGFFVEEDIGVEELNDEDMLHQVVTEFAGRFPHLKEVLIDERDTYMAERIRKIDADTVLAVVGAGHLEGITAQLQEQAPQEQEDLMATDPGFGWFRVATYLLPAAIVGMFAYGALNLGGAVAQDMFVYWFGLNAATAGIGAVLAGAGLLTVLVAAVGAPFTSINPAMPAGLVAAYAQNRTDPPRVEDMEGLGEIASYREMWSNRATKLLLVFFLVNLGSAVSTFVGAGVLARLAGLV